MKTVPKVYATFDLVGALAVGCTMLALVACDTPRNQGNVWDHYDVRTPLPYDSEVPDSAVNEINRYDPYRSTGPIDNDEYYFPPTVNCGIGELPACTE
jgi:hypothetical protein